MAWRIMHYIILAAALTGCVGEEFDQRAADISACVVGDWERLGPRMFNRDQRSLSFRADGTFQQKTTGSTSGGDWHVNIITGPWFQHGDNIVQAHTRIVDGYGASQAEADAEAEQALLVAPERSAPSVTSGSAHCDKSHYKSGVLVKYSSSPDVFRAEHYGGFRSNWPARMPAVLTTEQLTLSRNGIAEIQRTTEYFDGSGERTSTTTHAAYAYKSSGPDGTPVLALTTCEGQDGCFNPEPIPVGIDFEYVTWGTALSTGTRYGVGETTGKADYFSR